MKARRAFVALAGLAALIGPFCALSQSPGTRRIGLLVPSATTPHAEFRKRLAQLGWVEGKNLQIEMRSADNKFERFASLARELIDLRVELIVISTTAGAQAAKRATASVPIIFAHVADPEGAKLVKSLAKPGGNVTGVANRAAEIAVKQVELLKALVPALETVAQLRHSVMGPVALAQMSAQVRAGVAQAGLGLIHVDADKPDELEAAFAAAARGRAAGMLVPPAPLFFQQAKRIGELGIKFRIATVSASRAQVAAGGLASYGPDFTDAFARTARYVDAILRGAKPADLPVERADRFEVVINRRTAEALGLRLSQEVVLRATEVIE